MTPRVRAILESVGQEHGVTVDDLVGPRRTRHIAYARFQAMASVRAMRRVWSGKPVYSTPAIGRIFGGRDHTTVIGALRRARELGLVAIPSPSGWWNSAVTLQAAANYSALAGLTA